MGIGKPILRYPAREDATDILLVASYAGILNDIEEEVVKDRGLELVTVEGDVLDQPNTCCRYLASLTQLNKQLQGDTPEQQASISEWLSRRHTTLAHLTEEHLAEVDKQLLNQTFLLGHSITLPDLVLFAVLSRAVVNFPLAQQDRFVNIVRWYDYIANVIDKDSLLPKASFKKPALRPPAPPPPVAKVEKAGKEGAEAPKGEGPQGKGAAKGKAAPAPAASSASSSGAAPAPATPAASAAAPPSATADAGSEAQSAGGKKGKKEKKPAAAAPAAAASSSADAEPTVAALDLRVGQIVKVGLHPNAEALYVEEIDVGEDKPRQVISGLVKFVPVEAMQNRRVIVVCNLKPAKMRDVMSYGMVLCASDAAHEKVDPIMPPPAAAIGERVMCEGFEGEAEPVLNPKKKIFEQIAPSLRTCADGVARYKGLPFKTSAGNVTSSIPDGTIS